MQTRARHIGPRVHVLNFLSRFSIGKFKNRLAGTKPPPLGRTPLGPRPQAPVALSGPFRSPWARQRPPSRPPRAPSRRRRALAYPGPRALAYPGPRPSAYPGPRPSAYPGLPPSAYPGSCALAYPRPRDLAYPGPRALAYPGPREQATYVVEKSKIYIYILSHVHLLTGVLLLRTAYPHKAYVYLFKQPTPLYS